MGTLLQPAFSKGEVNPEVYGRVDIAAYKQGLAVARNMQVRTYGNIQNRPGLQHINYAINSYIPSRLRRFRFSTGDTYILEFSTAKMRVIRDDAYILESTGPRLVTGLTSSALCTITTSTVHGWSVGDDIELSGLAGDCGVRMNNRRFRIFSTPTTTTAILLDIITNLVLDASNVPAFTAGGAATRVYTLAHSYLAADIPRLVFVQSADVITITHPSYPETKLARIAPDHWTLTAASFVPSTAAPAGVAVTPTTTGTTTTAYVVTAINAATGEESAPSAPVSIANSNATINNTITWSAGTGISLYSVYRAVNGIYGFIGDTPALSFVDNNFIPDLSTTPPRAFNPFPGTNYYPAASGYYQQRQVRGGSNAQPDTAFYSQIGNFYNYNKSVPSTDGDAITATMTSREVNQIRYFVPGKDLLVFTAGAEWRVNAGGAGIGFSASTMVQTTQSAWGCDYLEPIPIGLTTLFVPQGSITVRSMTYTYLADNYTGSELTLLSNHLFGAVVQGVPQTIVSWAYGRTPDPIVYTVRSDGAAAVMTYVPGDPGEDAITAWCHWDTQGTFEWVETVRPSLDVTDDYAYFVVNRSINGHPVKTIERLHTRRFTDVRDCFFVDAGLSYDSPRNITFVSTRHPTVVVQAPGHGLVDGDLIDFFDIKWTPKLDTFDNEVQPAQLNTKRFMTGYMDANQFMVKNLDGSLVDGTAFSFYQSGGTVRKAIQTVVGLDHLEGMAVVALADGNYVGGLTVNQGAVTIPFLASRIHVGLKYISDVQTLDLEAPQGSIQGKYKEIPYVTVRFTQSRGLFAGANFTNMNELKQRQYEPIGDPTALYTGDATVTVPGQFRGNGQVCLRQRYPLPMDILDIMPEVTVEE